jgi:hypothetical protein
VENPNLTQCESPVNSEFITQVFALWGEILHGFIIRDNSGENKLHGFICWIDKFTIYKSTFCWTNHPNEIPNTGITSTQVENGYHDNGTLSKCLINCEYNIIQGDTDMPQNQTIQSPEIASIIMVGAKKCGTAILESATADMLETNRGYKVMVLDSISESISFYQKCGFVRVGAVA